VIVSLSTQFEYLQEFHRLGAFSWVLFSPPALIEPSLSKNITLDTFGQVRFPPFLGFVHPMIIGCDYPKVSGYLSLLRFSDQVFNL
jgi:hypothetical protein